MEIRLAREIESDSIVDGEGIRTVIWTQGCIHNCLGCHHPETHSFTGGFKIDIEKLKEKIKSLENQDGITLSGGDPICQVDPVLEIAKFAKKIGLNVWCYTGYLIDDLLERSKKDKKLLELLNNIDVLVDGKFILEKRSLDIIFRGSTNQRIIDVKKSLLQDKPVLVDKYKEKLAEKKFNRKTYI